MYLSLNLFINHNYGKHVINIGHQMVFHGTETGQILERGRSEFLISSTCHGLSLNSYALLESFGVFYFQSLIVSLFQVQNTIKE